MADLRQLGLDRTRARKGAVRPELTPSQIRGLLADLGTGIGLPFIDAASQAAQGNYGQAAVSGLLDAPPVKMAGMALAPIIGAIKKSPIDYGMMHRPMSVEGGAARLFEPEKAFGEDIFTKNALQYFGSGDMREKSIINLMRAIRGNPEAEVTIYRGIPKGVGKSINVGDWVTLDKNVAKEYGPNVIEKKVKARDITTWPDSLLEFGYYPE